MLLVLLTLPFSLCVCFKVSMNPIFVQLCSSSIQVTQFFSTVPCQQYLHQKEDVQSIKYLFISGCDPGGAGVWESSHLQAGAASCWGIQGSRLEYLDFKTNIDCHKNIIVSIRIETHYWPFIVNCLKSIVTQKTSNVICELLRGTFIMQPNFFEEQNGYLFSSFSETIFSMINFFVSLNLRK